MRKLADAAAVSTILFSIVACSDAIAPISRGLQAPATLRKTVNGPPDVITTIGPKFLDNAVLHNFPYETWVTLEVTGNVGFTSLPKAQGTSSYYQYPGRSDLTATGIYDGRQDTGCAMNLSVVGAVFNGGNFGFCGQAQHPNISKIVGASVKVMRGPPPYQWSYDCDPWGNKVCHTVTGSQSVRMRPVPVTLNKLTANPRTIDTLHLAPVQFTGSITPDSVIVQGVKPHPYHVTLWQWIGADSTRDPALTGAGKGPGCTSTLLCRYTPPESGRMVLKVFVGGFEQTSTVTVQCVTNPSDMILNDSINNFTVRDSLLAALQRSNPDSAPGRGASAQGRGHRHEEGGVIWLLPDGSYLAVSNIDPTATECHFSPQQGPAPVAGAYVVAVYHTHPGNRRDKVYGCNGEPGGVQWSQYPGDGLPVPPMEDPKQAGGGSGWQRGSTKGDWPNADTSGFPDYILQKDGTVWRLDPNPGWPKKNNPNHWNAFGNGYDKNKPAGKCTWAKTYAPN